MKAFWWFKDEAVAGMARPGFNAVHWLKLPADENAIIGWIGTLASGRHRLAEFHHHLDTYLPKTFAFTGLTESAGFEMIAKLKRQEEFSAVLQRLIDRAGVVSEFSIRGAEIDLELCPRRFETEREFLHTNRIERVVSLTEKHHVGARLGDAIDIHHLSIPDLGAPSLEQVDRLAKLIDESRAKSKRIAVHCMAGIGRTSTMLIAAHIRLGEKPEEVLARVSERNPSFRLTGSQGEFIQKIIDSVN